MVFILYFLSIVAAPDAHAVYLSTIDVTLEDREISVTIKVFEDDLRDALRAHHGHVIDTTSVHFLSEIESYFKVHFGIEEVALSAVRVSLVGDSYQVGMTGLVKPSMGSLSFMVDYFTELFPTQQNVLHLTYEDFNKYHIFKKGKEVLEVDL